MYDVSISHMHILILEIFTLYSMAGKWRRNGIQVYTSRSPRQGNSGTPCGAKITGGDDGSDILDITTRTCNEKGRYVTVYKDYNNPKSSTAMDFCEFEVKGELN